MTMKDFIYIFEFIIDPLDYCHEGFWFQFDHLFPENLHVNYTNIIK